MWPCTTERPHWGPNQVRTLRGIIPDRFYFRICRSMKINGSLIRISSPPCTEKGFGPFVKIIRFYQDNDGLTDETSLADKSVVSSGNDWNYVNFLLRTRAKTVKGALRSLKKKVEQLKSQIQPVQPPPDIFEDEDMDYPDYPEDFQLI